MTLYLDAKMRRALQVRLFVHQFITLFQACEAIFQHLCGRFSYQNTKGALCCTPSRPAMSSNGATAAVDMIAGMEKQERILVIDFGSQAELC